MSSSAKLGSEKQDVPRCSNPISKIAQMPVWCSRCCYRSLVKSTTQFLNVHRLPGPCFRCVPQSTGVSAVWVPSPMPGWGPWRWQGAWGLPRPSSSSQVRLLLLLQGNAALLTAWSLGGRRPVFSVTKARYRTLGSRWDSHGKLPIRYKRLSRNCLFANTGCKRTLGRERSHFIRNCLFLYLLALVSRLAKSASLANTKKFSEDFTNPTAL